MSKFQFVPAYGRLSGPSFEAQVSRFLAEAAATAQWERVEEKPGVADTGKDGFMSAALVRLLFDKADKSALGATNGKLSDLEDEVAEKAAASFLNERIRDVYDAVALKADSLDVAAGLAGKVDSSLFQVEMAGKAAVNHPHRPEDIEGLAGELERKANAKHPHAIVDVDGLDAALDSVRDFAENVAHGAGLPAGGDPHNLVFRDEDGEPGWVSPAELAGILPTMSSAHPGVAKAGKGLAVNDHGELYYTGAGVDTPVINHGDLEGKSDPGAHPSTAISHGDVSVFDTLEAIDAELDCKAGIDAVETLLTGKSNVNHRHTVDDTEGVSDLLATKADKGALADYALNTALTAGLNGKANVSHSHADYALNTALTAGLNGKANVSHSHAVANITSLQALLDGKANVSHSHAVANITSLQALLDGKVGVSDNRLTNARPPTAHAATHRPGGADPVTPASIGAATPADITNAIGGKSNVGHGHAQSEISGLPAVLTAKSNVGHVHSAGEIYGLSGAPAPKAGEGVGQWRAFTSWTPISSGIPGTGYYAYHLPAGGTWAFAADAFKQVGIGAGGSVAATFTTTPVGDGHSILCWRIA